MRIVLFIPGNIYRTRLARDFSDALTSSLSDKATVEVTGRLRSVRHPSKSIDALHVIGCWSLPASRAIAIARRRGIPTVYTPLCGLSPWTMSRSRLMHIVKTAAWQYTMTRHAGVIHVGGPEEKEYMEHLGWNSNIRLIANPILTHEISSGTLASQLFDIYRQADNAAVRETALKAARAVEHIHQEGSGSEKDVCRLIYILHLRVRRRDIPMRYIRELHHVLMTTELDEDILAAMLRKLHIYHFMASLETVMSHLTQLPEGFMPIPSRNDRQAARLEKIIC